MFGANQSLRLRGSQYLAYPVCQPLGFLIFSLSLPLPSLFKCPEHNVDTSFYRHGYHSVKHGGQVHYIGRYRYVLKFISLTLLYQIRQKDGGCKDTKRRDCSVEA